MSAGPMPVSLALTLENRMDEVPRLVERLDAFGTATRLPDELSFRLTAALDEVVTNIIRHAFAAEGGHHIVIRLEVEHGTVTAVVEDDGPPFDPRTRPPVDIHAPVSERRPGGLGVHIVRTVTQRIEYERSGDRNVLTLTLVAAPRAS